MILRAFDRGVPEAKLARVLNVKIEHINRRRKLLNGNGQSAEGQVGDPPATFNVLWKMKASR
jgi:hypothetical protein